MQKSEPKANPTFITCTTRYVSSERGPLRLIEVLAPLESNFEVDPISHYRKSIELQHPMYIATRHYMLKFVTYYPLHLVSL